MLPVTSGAELQEHNLLAGKRSLTSLLAFSSRNTLSVQAFSSRVWYLLPVASTDPFSHCWLVPCCGSGKFIPDPNFFYPGTRVKKIPGSWIWIRIRIKEFKYFNPKMVSKLSEILSVMFIPDPDFDFLPIPDPGYGSAILSLTDGVELW
jgi:hypothetical protein